LSQMMNALLAVYLNKILTRVTFFAQSSSRLAQCQCLRFKLGCFHSEESSFERDQGLDRLAFFRARCHSNGQVHFHSCQIYY
jgi:hypothetical protein